MHEVWILTGVPKWLGAGDRRVNIAVVETREDLEAARQCFADEYERIESERFPIEMFAAPKGKKTTESNDFAWNEAIKGLW